MNVYFVGQCYETELVFATEYRSLFGDLTFDIFFTTFFAMRPSTDV